MRMSEYEDFCGTFRVLSDAEVKNDEDINKAEVKLMRNETPMPRKSWGATRGSGGKPGLPTRVRKFDVSKPIGLRVNLNNMEVSQATPGSQGNSVRVGWRLTNVDDDPVRSAMDFKRALGKLKSSARPTKGSGATDEGARLGPIITKWTFEVPPKSKQAAIGPPLAVISGQKVKLKKDESDRRIGSTEHRERIAFRLDANKEYMDLHGDRVEPEPKLFPEGKKKVELEQQGSFPQTGQRIPLFGEAWEDADGTSVSIETLRTVKFPAAMPKTVPDTETHGAFPDPKEPLRDATTTYSVSAVKEQFQLGRDVGKQGVEAALLKAKADLETMREQAEATKKLEDEVERVKEQMRGYKEKANNLENELQAQRRRAAPVAAPTPSILLSKRRPKQSRDDASLPTYKTNPSVASEGISGGEENDPPLEEKESDLGPLGDDDDNAAGGGWLRDSKDVIGDMTGEGDPSKAWNRLHSMHSDRIAKRDMIYHEGIVTRKRKEAASCFVGVPVDILSSKSESTDEDAGAVEGAEDNDGGGGETGPKVVGKGVVKSYDATKGRFVVLLPSGKLVSVKSQFIRRTGSGRDASSPTRARATGADAKKRSSASTSGGTYGATGPGAKYEPSLELLAEKVKASSAISTKLMHVTAASKGRLAELSKKKQDDHTSALELKRRQKKMKQRRNALGENKRKGSNRNPDIYNKMVRPGMFDGMEDDDILNLDDLMGDGGEAQMKEAADATWERMKSYVKKEHSRVIDVFKSFDRDGSGALDATEFGQALEKMGIEANGEVVQGVMKLADPNGDGNIEYGELMRALNPEPSVAKPPQDEAGVDDGGDGENETAASDEGGD